MIRIKKECSCGSDALFKKYGKISILLCSNKKCVNYNANWNYIGEKKRLEELKNVQEI